MVAQQQAFILIQLVVRTCFYLCVCFQTTYMRGQITQMFFAPQTSPTEGPVYNQGR